MDGQGAEESGDVLVLGGKASRRRVPVVAPCYLTAESVKDTEIWGRGVVCKAALASAARRFSDLYLCGDRRRWWLRCNSGVRVSRGGRGGGGRRGGWGVGDG